MPQTNFGSGYSYCSNEPTMNPVVKMSTLQTLHDCDWLIIHENGGLLFFGFKEAPESPPASWLMARTPFHSTQEQQWALTYLNWQVSLRSQSGDLLYLDFTRGREKRALCVKIEYVRAVPRTYAVKWE